MDILLHSFNSFRYYGSGDGSLLCGLGVLTVSYIVTRSLIVNEKAPGRRSRYT